jgi:hypothetical protein
VFASHPFVDNPSQSAVFVGHASTHVPAAQYLPAPQGWLHPPQCAFDVFVSVSQPFAWLPSQLPYPGLQLPNVQVPVAHDSLAFA